MGMMLVGIPKNHVLGGTIVEVVVGDCCGP